MREELHPGGSDDDSDSSQASADAATLHAVARRIQLREHARRQEQLQLHKRLQQQQQLLQQQQQQLHQQDALLRHQEQVLRQQEQQLASRETEAGLLLQQVGLLQQQLEERADRLAAAEGNYLDTAALFRQLQERVTMGAEARQLVEEVRQQQQQDSHHLYAEVRRLRRQLSLRMRLSASSEYRNKGSETDRDKERAAEHDAVVQLGASSEPTAAGDSRQQRQQQGTDEQSLASVSPLKGSADDVSETGGWCCVEAVEAAACTAWGCSACCNCNDDAQHEAAVEELRVALHKCRCAMESQGGSEAIVDRAAAAAAEAAILAVREALHRCPAAGADAEIVDLLLEHMRSESMQIRVYAQQRRAAAAPASGSSAVLQYGGLTTVDESLEREAYDMMGTALPQDVLLPLLAVQNISTLLRLKQQGVLLANSRWLQLLKDTVGSKFLEGSSCCSRGSSTCSGSSNASSNNSGNTAERKSGGACAQMGSLGENSTSSSGNSGEGGTERRQHVLLQLLLRGSGGVPAAAGLLRQSTAPLALHAATLTDRESGNNVFHLLCLRNLPQLFGVLSLSSLPNELIYARNRQGQTPSDLLLPLLPPQLHKLKQLQQAAIAGEVLQQAELQQQLGAVTVNLRAWRSVVFEYAAKASALYRQHNNEAALSLYTEALKLQQRLLDKQQQLDEVTGGNGASSLSLLENTAKLAFNKARSALRLGRWICSLKSCTLCLSMTPNYKAAYETAAEACEWLLDFEGALNYIQLLRQHCPEAFSAEHFQKRRLYEAQLLASSFQVLGIDKGATKAAVNRAFRRMSILWHPDKASALSEDLRLRHENHFKRLNEARIALLDPESYARQLLVPFQTLYRHPELLVAPTRSQQSSSSSAFLLQPDQLSTEQLQHDHQPQQPQHQREQQQEQHKETEDVGPSLEQLQQQRQQLLRSIGSLQRQQHELQRELEEQHAAASQGMGSSSACASLRWQELQKLHQQQQNKQKKLEECETEIGEKLSKQLHDHVRQQREQDLQKEGGNELERSEKDDATSGSSPTNRSWRPSTPMQRQKQQPQNDCNDGTKNDSVASPEGFDRDVSTEPPPSGPTVGASAATSAAAAVAASAAAEVIREAAAAALSGQRKDKRANTLPTWTSIMSSDSDTDASTLHGVYREEAASSGGSCTTSAGIPTAATAVPTPSPSERKASSSVQVGPASKTRTATAAALGTGHARLGFRGCRTMGRSCSRASSAGPQLCTGEAVAASSAASTATARRSLTTCICSSASRRTAAASRKGGAPHPIKRSTAYWEETDSSSSSSSSTSSDSSEGSDSAGDDKGGDRTSDKNDKSWAGASEYTRNRFAAASSSSNVSTGAGLPTSSGPASARQQAQQQRLPTPPPRRVLATQGTQRVDGGGSNETKAREPGRRPVLRTQEAQRQQSNTQPPQHEQHRQRQQLWPGTGRGDVAGSSSPTRYSAAPQHPAATTSQASVGGDWLRPPDFPEPFAAAPREPQQHDDSQNAASGLQQQQKQQQFGHSLEESSINAMKQRANEHNRQSIPEVFGSPVMLSQSFDIHCVQQQELPLQQPLQRKLQPQRDVQETCDSTRHQLLFPDEVLFRNPRAVSAAAAKGTPAVIASASASSCHPAAASPPDDPSALFDSGWAAFEGADASPTGAGTDEISGANAEKRHRWPVPPQSGPEEQESSNNDSAASRSTTGTVPITNRRAIPTKGPGAGHSVSATEMHKRISGNGCIDESCTSSENSSVHRSCSSKSNRSQSCESDSADEEPSKGSGHERVSHYNHRHQHPQEQHHQHERFYRSVAHETPHLLRSPPEADSIFLMQWGMGTPQRNSMPVLGCASSGSNSSATLRKDAAATATPTRLFPHYGSTHLDAQQGSQALHFSRSSFAPGDDKCESTAASFVSGGPAARTIGESTRDNDMSDEWGLLRDEGPVKCEASGSVCGWRPLLTRSSLPHPREEALLHSPRTPHM